MSDAEDVAFKEMFPLVIGLLAGMAVFFFIIAKIISGGSEELYIPAGMTKEQAVSERIAPVGAVNMGGPVLAEAEPETGGGAAASDTPQSGEQVYTGVCGTCHDNGLAGAPVTGDTADWQGRLEARGGYETLYNNALNGYKGMPAKGGANISEEELDRAVRYILEESGVSP